ncbi:MAG: hypothetical protein INH41_25890 [Myxococcaceae bacterium]|nr:hypothetical protein [Myxococcaceae bacterium]MCA3015834.1 hypothetical protein [Myxococcaceae bacterium]
MPATRLTAPPAAATASALATLCVLAGVALSDEAHAFSVATAATAGCHERITLEAAAAAGEHPTRAVTRDDRALHAALPFFVPEPWDRATLALLVGVREPDFRGAAAHDLVALAAVHLSPTHQHEHCLRGPVDDGGDGDATALARCSRFIEHEVELALRAGPDDLESVTVALTVGARPVSVLSRPYRLGRALHALQDSFAHGLRDEGFGRVRALLNYVDPLLAAPYQLDRDGHPHVSALDACGGAHLTPLAVAARDASRDLLAAVAVDTPGDLHRAAVHRALAQHLRHEPACEGSAAWCVTAQGLLDERLGEAVGCNSTGGGLGLWGLGLAVAWAAHRRRPRGLALSALVASAASGQPPLPRDGLAGVVTLGGSAERGAFIFGAGLRRPVTTGLELRADAEWNPWFDVLAGKTSTGALNARVGVRSTWARAGAVSVGSSLGAGVSVLLHDTVGARLGAVGPCLVLAPLEVVLPGPGTTLLEVAPEAALVIPSLAGIPLLYHQYRLTLSVRLGPAP